MTCIERLETLLNRAGQTLSDAFTDHSDEQIMAYLGKNNVIDMTAELFYMVEIIDRLETALENVCGERGYLLMRMNDTLCGKCVFCECADDCQGLCENTDFCLMENEIIPEDWDIDAEVRYQNETEEDMTEGRQ